MIALAFAAPTATAQAPKATEQAPKAVTQTDASANGVLMAADLARGRALYGSACDTCHSQNIHWRDKRVATSWETLVKEVTRWQGNIGRRWEPAEIRDVAAYLNERFYYLPCPGNECVDKQAAAGVPDRSRGSARRFQMHEVGDVTGTAFSASGAFTGKPGRES